MRSKEKKSNFPKSGSLLMREAWNALENICFLHTFLFVEGTTLNFVSSFAVLLKCVGNAMWKESYKTYKCCFGGNHILALCDFLFC